MKYLLDTNTLSGNLFEIDLQRNDLFILREVVEEKISDRFDISRIYNSKLNVIDPSLDHFEKMKEVLAEHGDNFNLISLFTGKGTADIIMIAYILFEQDNPETLFDEEYTLVTNDRELSEVAKSYGIKCVSKI